MRTLTLEAQLTVLRAEYLTLRAALAEVIAEDDRHHPCEHPIDPTGANGCTHCYGRYLVAITEEDV